MKEGGFMINNSITTTIIGLALLLGFSVGSMQAGAILNLYRIDVPNKTIIMFGEQHDGEVHFENEVLEEEIEIPVSAVEQNQQRALSHLFNSDLSGMRNATTIYIECNDDLCESLRTSFLTNLETYNADQLGEELNKGWFAHYHQIFYAMCHTGSNAASAIKNFDARSTLDLALSFCAIELTKIVDEYIERNCDDTYLATAKEKFFADDNYQIFKINEQDWINKVAQPVIETAIRLQGKVTPEVTEQMFEEIYQGRIRLEMLESKARFANQDIFQFLFAILELTKKEFPKLLPDLCGMKQLPESPNDESESEEMTVWDIVELSCIGPDLQLIEKAINDTSRIVLVHCGNAHASRAYEYFKMMNPQGVQTRSINLIQYPIMNNETTYQVMRNLIFNV